MYPSINLLLTGQDEFELLFEGRTVKDVQESYKIDEIIVKKVNKAPLLIQLLNGMIEKLFPFVPLILLEQEMHLMQRMSIAI